MFLNLWNYSYKLNVWDVGGQKSLRSYWRNYFESTDGLIWVVDSADKRRLNDCTTELHSLIEEEVFKFMLFSIKKLVAFVISIKFFNYLIIERKVFKNLV